MEVEIEDQKAATRPGVGLGSSHRILRNSTFNFASQILNALFNLVLVFTLARGLGPKAMGAYYALFSWITAVQLIMEMGTSTVLTRHLVQGHDDWKDTVAEVAGCFVFIGLASVLGMAAVGAMWAWYRDDPALLLHFTIAGIACAAIQVERFCAGVFRAFDMFGFENLGRILQGAILAILVGALVLLDVASVGWAVAMLAVSHLAVAVLMIGCLWRHLGHFPVRLSIRASRYWLGEAFSLGVGDVIRGWTWQLDTVLLDWLQPREVVGIYSVAYRPLGPLNWLPRAVLAAAFPSFAKLAGADPESLGRSFANSIRLLWIVSLPIAIAICACAEPIVVLLGGKEYLDAAPLLRILIWITVLSFLSTQFRFVFAAMGQQHILTRLIVVVFFLEAGVEAALIPFWGYYGSCTGSVLGETVFTAVGLYICRSHLGMGQIAWGALARSTLAGLAMGAVLWLTYGWYGSGDRGVTLPSWIMLVVIVGLATLLYFGLCILLGALQSDEIRRFVAALTGRGRKARGADLGKE